MTHTLSTHATVVVMHYNGETQLSKHEHVPEGALCSYSTMSKVSIETRSPLFDNLLKLYLRLIFLPENFSKTVIKSHNEVSSISE